MKLVDLCFLHAAPLELYFHLLKNKGKGQGMVFEAYWDVKRTIRILGMALCSLILRSSLKGSSDSRQSFFPSKYSCFKLCWNACSRLSPSFTAAHLENLSCECQDSDFLELGTSERSAQDAAGAAWNCGSRLTLWHREIRKFSDDFNNGHWCDHWVKVRCLSPCP